MIEILVSISIIALLIAMLLPMLQSSRAAARQMTCASQLRSMHQLAHVYATDWNGWMMPAFDSGVPTAHRQWPYYMWTVMGSFDHSLSHTQWTRDPLFTCPERAQARYPYRSYGMNIRFGSRTSPSATFPSNHIETVLKTDVIFMGDNNVPNADTGNAMRLDRPVTWIGDHEHPDFRRHMVHNANISTFDGAVRGSQHDSLAWTETRFWTLR